MAEIAIKPSISIIDHHSLEKKNNELLHLAMELRPECFIYTIVDKEKNCFLAFEEYTFTESGNFQSLHNEIKDLIEQIPFIRNWKSSCSVAINHSIATIIPNPLFNETKMERYLSINFELNREDPVLFDDLTNVKAKNIFTFPKRIQSFFLQHFERISFHHFSTSVIEPFALQYKNRNKPKVVINVQRCDFQIIMFDLSVLKLYNSFKYQNEDDFVYFIMFAFEQLKVDANKIEVKLTGLIDDQNALYKKLKVYISNLTFEEYQPQFKLTIPSHQIGRHYYSIFNQFACVS